MTPIPQHKAAEREALARAAQQYLRAGGSIKRLPGPSMKPIPLRKDPPRKPAPKREKKIPKRYQEVADVVLQKFHSGVPLKTIGADLGRSADFVVSCLGALGIDARGYRAEQRLKRDAEEVPVIRMLAADGHSIRFVAEQLGISASRVRYQADRYGIQFKGAAT